MKEKHSRITGVFWNMKSGAESNVAQRKMYGSRLDYQGTIGRTKYLKLASYSSNSFREKAGKINICSDYFLHNREKRCPMYLEKKQTNHRLQSYSYLTFLETQYRLNNSNSWVGWAAWCPSIPGVSQECPGRQSKEAFQEAIS
jgi:hypothetical protein